MGRKWRKCRSWAPHLPRCEQWDLPRDAGTAKVGKQGALGWGGLPMGPLESILRGLGRDRTHLPTILPVMLESSVWSQDPKPPAPGSLAQLSKCGIDQLAAGLLCHCLPNESSD